MNQPLRSLCAGSCLAKTEGSFVQADVAEVAVWGPAYAKRSDTSQAILRKNNRQETRLELLWVHEADRDSGLVEDTHHLARHVVCDDWALCAASA
jgi:hypothetical protein